VAGVEALGDALPAPDHSAGGDASEGAVLLRQFLRHR
jgi:hypothetical protein